MIPGTQTLTMNDQVTIGVAVSVNTLLIHFYILRQQYRYPQTSATHDPPFGYAHSIPGEIRQFGTILVFSDILRKNDPHIGVLAAFPGSGGGTLSGEIHLDLKGLTSH